MTLNEFFEQLSIDGQKVLDRFQGNQALLLYFLRKFPKDPQYQQILDAEVNGDFDQLEMAVHTMKGVSANLGLDRLYEVCTIIVSDIREGNKEEALSSIGRLTEEYEKTISCIDKLQ